MASTPPRVGENRASPLVGVVILNWNRAHLTIRCAESVLKSDYERFFVVIVDNGSTDGSGAVLSRWTDESSRRLASLGRSDDVRSIYYIHRESNAGYGAGNNIGMRLALDRGADAVWVLNNDTTVDEAALGHLVATFRERPSTGLIGSLILDSVDRATVQCLGGGTYGKWTSRSRPVMAGDMIGSLADTFELDYVNGAAIFLGRNCLYDVGGFEEGYFLYCEEVDLARRAATAGWAMTVAAKSLVWHAGGATAGSHADLDSRSLTSYFYGTRSAVLLARKFSQVAVPTVVLARAFFALSLLLRRRGAAARTAVRGLRSGLAARGWSRAPLLRESTTDPRSLSQD